MFPELDGKLLLYFCNMFLCNCLVIEFFDVVNIMLTDLRICFRFKLSIDDHFDLG